MFYSSAFLITLVILGATAGPFYPTKNGKPAKYFWYPTDDGRIVPAFLEGGPPPANASNVNEIRFLLYTKNNPTQPDTLTIDCPSCLEASNFDRNVPVKILCHGFSSSHEGGFGSGIREGYLRHRDKLNLIMINWSTLAAAPWYETAAQNTRLVGEHTRRLINFLISQGVTSVDRIHYVGHSLGAHVGGFCANHMGSLGKLPRITALDPALPLFGSAGPSDRIDESDAHYVDIVHTAGGGLGIHEPHGHADFYPNGGQASQPGCGVDLAGSCSHSRAHEFMAESAWRPDAFRACKCNNWNDYTSGACDCLQQAYMGDPSSTAARGNYYLRTNANAPFGQG